METVKETRTGRIDQIEQEARQLFQLGRRYMEGDGLERDEEKAVRLYFKALSIWEDPQVDHEVGRSYCLGIGIERNPEIAKRFMRRGTHLYPETLGPLVRMEIETGEMEAALYYGQLLPDKGLELDAELERVRTGRAEGRMTSQACVERLRELSAAAAPGNTVCGYAVSVLGELLDTGSLILDYKINVRLNRYVEKPDDMWKDAVFWAVLAEQLIDGNEELQVPVSPGLALSAAFLSLACSYPPEKEMPLPARPWQKEPPELREALGRIRGGDFSPALIDVVRRYADAGSGHAAAELYFLSRYVDSERDTEEVREAQLDSLPYPPRSKNCLLMAAAAQSELDPESCLELAHMLDGAHEGGLKDAPAASLLVGVYFMCTVRLYEQRFAQGDLEAGYHLRRVYGSQLLGDDRKAVFWTMEGVRKGYAPSVQDAVYMEAMTQSLAEKSYYEGEKWPAPLMALAQSLPDNFYRKPDVVRTVSEITATLKLLAENLQRDTEQRIRNQLRAEEKKYVRRLDRQERIWNLATRGVDLTSEDWAIVDWYTQNTVRLVEYGLYKLDRDEKERKNSARVREKLEDEVFAERAQWRSEREPADPKIKGLLAAMSFSEPGDWERWLREAGLGDTMRLLLSLRPFDYEKANEEYRLSEQAETAGGRRNALKNAARMGHKLALFQQGRILEAALLWHGEAMVAYYQKNQGTELGREMLRRAVMVENTDAEYMQAKVWIYKEGCEGAGQELLNKLSGQGHAEAKRSLAICFQKGIGGVEENPEMALSLMEEVAETGDAYACYQLGSFYAAGMSGKPDGANAVKWYSKAAELGSNEALSRIARLYLDGGLVERDLHQGLAYCVWGVLVTDVRCGTIFSKLNEETIGDLERWYGYPQPEPAKKWGVGLFRQLTPEEQAIKNVKKELAAKGCVEYSDDLEAAAAAGFVRAQELLGDAYLRGVYRGRRTEDRYQAFLWYDRAAQQGSPYALQRLAWWFDSGVPLFRNEPLARAYARLAAERGGGSYAMYWQLGEPGEAGGPAKPSGNYTPEQFYDMGQACAGKNEENAFHNFLQAAQGGHPTAQQEVGDRYSAGRGVARNQTKAVRWYRTGSESGDAQSMCSLAKCYEKGEGVAKDVQQAVEWYRKAAEKGSARAMYNLGLCYEYAKGVSQDEEEAFRWYERSAQAGHADGQFETAYRYAMGKGTEKSDKQAVFWYQKAAEQGNTTAMLNLGFCYGAGRGVSQDEEEAFRWYERAAQAGDADSQLVTAYRYEIGKGTEKNVEQALFWYRKAAEQGKSQAMYNLGVYYVKGWGVSQDDEEAFRWYERSAQAGNAGGQFETGYCYGTGKGTEKNVEQALFWYRKAAEQGNSQAMYNLGIYYVKGWGVSQDEEEAFRWYERSAQAGHAGGQAETGYRYKMGKGTEKNVEQAVFWFRKGAENGSNRAMYHLGVCYGQGSGVEKDQEKAVYWYRKAAEQGNTQAMCGLGELLLDGEGVEKDPKAAVEWFQRAVEKDSVRGKYLLGRCLLDGNGIEEDRGAGLKLLREAAERDYKPAREFLDGLAAD